MVVKKTRRHLRRETKKLRDAYLPGPRQCRPRVGTKCPDYGCLPPMELAQLAHRILGKTDIHGGAGINRTSALRKLLEAKMGIAEGNELSFINALPIDENEKNRLRQTYLRPAQPVAWKSDPDMWLDSTNIKDVMDQYEKDLPDFKFLGPYPIDFAAPDPYNQTKTKCLISEMCSIDSKALLRQGIHRIGIIYNLDPHTKNGSHWVANYVDLKKHHCYYFDSYGMAVPDQIEKFMQWLTLEDPKMKLARCARRFQFKGSECGMYSMYFIIRMLMGEEFRHFCRRAPRDGAMLSLRSWLFST